jgi:hypothetical protein
MKMLDIVDTNPPGSDDVPITVALITVASNFEYRVLL